jgi:hypothetical protein
VVAQSVYDCALHIIVGYTAYNEDNEPIKSVVNSLPKIEALAMQPQNDNQLTHPPFGQNGDRSTLRILLGVLPVSSLECTHRLFTTVVVCIMANLQLQL